MMSSTRTTSSSSSSRSMTTMMVSAVVGKRQRPPEEQILLPEQGGGTTTISEVDDGCCRRQLSWKNTSLRQQETARSSSVVSFVDETSSGCYSYDACTSQKRCQGDNSKKVRTQSSFGGRKDSSSSCFTFRLEHRRQGNNVQNDDVDKRQFSVASARESILLFRSDQAGSIGKVLFSWHGSSSARCCHKTLPPITSKGKSSMILHVTIDVLFVQEDYRGFDFGGLLFQEALNRLQEECDGASENAEVHCSFVAKEDVARPGKLVEFYKTFGAERKTSIATTTQGGSPQVVGRDTGGEALHRIPMKLILLSGDYFCRDSCVMSRDCFTSFLPVSFLVPDASNGDNIVPLTWNGERRCSWFMMEQADGEFLIQRSRWQSRNVRIGDHSSIVLRSCRQQTCQNQEQLSHYIIWTIQSTVDGFYLDTDPWTYDLRFSRMPCYWRRCEETFSFVKCEESPTLRSYYRLSWSRETVSFVEKMRQKYFNFGICKMGIAEALEMASRIPAVDPSLTSTCPSLRTVAFATAEQARNEGQPDWIQFIALVRGLAGILKRIHISKSIEEPEPDMEWTIADVDARVVGCKAPDCCSFSEYRVLNNDETDPRYNSYMGMYHSHRGIGLENVLLSWSSSEYMYWMLKHNKTGLPDEAYKILKLSPLVDWHSRHQYQHLAAKDDEIVKQAAANFHRMCSNVKACMLKTVEDFSEAKCHTLWYSHYAFLVRKFVGEGNDLLW